MVHLEPLKGAAALAEYWYETRWAGDNHSPASNKDQRALGSDEGAAPLPRHGGGLDRKTGAPSHTEL